MKKLVLSIAALAAALGPVFAAPAFAGSGAIGAGVARYDHGGREERREVADNRWNNRWDRQEDRRQDRWDRREDRWDRRENRWDRREDRWDRREYRRDRRHDDWGYRGWDRGRHNGYYYRNEWFFGPPPRAYYGDRYYRPAYRHWERGYYAPHYYRERIVDDYYDYGLRRPPHGYRWVRADHDFLLIAIATGLIADVIINDY